jgi:hypothetical protein
MILFLKSNRKKTIYIYDSSIDMIFLNININYQTHVQHILLVIIRDYINYGFRF